MNTSTVKKSRKGRLFAISAFLLLLTGGGAAEWFSQNASAEASLDKHGVEVDKPPVFVNLEPFTVNLQPEDRGEQFLQVSFTVQLADNDQLEFFKLKMPEVRSLILLALNSKKASEISTTEGKNKLSSEILAKLNQPSKPLETSQKVSGVFFTSFVIQ